MMDFSPPSKMGYHVKSNFERKITPHSGFTLTILRSPYTIYALCSLDEPYIIQLGSFTSQPHNVTAPH